MSVPEYDVYWNGTQDHDGTCPALSTSPRKSSLAPMLGTPAKKHRGHVDRVFWRHPRTYATAKAEMQAPQAARRGPQR